MDVVVEEKGANWWNTGLRAACEGGNMEIAKMMIKKGAYDWNGALHSLRIGGHLGGKLEQIIISYNLDVKRRRGRRMILN